MQPMEINGLYNGFSSNVPTLYNLFILYLQNPGAVKVNSVLGLTTPSETAHEQSCSIQAARTVSSLAD